MLKRRNIYFISILLVCLPSLFFFTYKVYSNFEDVRSKLILQEKKRKAWINLNKALQNKVNNFRGEVGLVIKDFDSGREISFNKNKLMPAASLVKLPILLSYYYAAREGKVSLDDNVRVRGSQIVGGSKVLGNARGEVFSVDALFKPMITQSDNTATNILIERMGFSALNTYFKKLGLKKTNLSRKMLDFKERRQGNENYTTASDMAFLLEELYRKEFLNKEISEKCLELLVQQKINDRIPKKLPKGVYVAHKTGLERHICHDVGIVFTDKGDFLICVMAKHNDRYAKSAKKFISEVALLTYRYCQLWDDL
ncbi:MAG: class A beta-lactamase-related serine hydrolase [Candidatus Omnitrophica bacterium]|nr:class A beta-lactamase-related serine hydrolase [Candidatus Omnitrophota bacterium]